jgi:hypothetical protein
MREGARLGGLCDTLSRLRFAWAAYLFLDWEGCAYYAAFGFSVALGDAAGAI